MRRPASGLPPKAQAELSYYGGDVNLAASHSAVPQVKEIYLDISEAIQRPPF
jgi:hypothetical protein